MEEKMFGVRISLVQELRLFQLNLRKKRRAMPFTCMAQVRINGGHTIITQVIVEKQSLSVVQSAIINGCPVPKQIHLELEETGLYIKLEDFLFLTIIFNTMEDRVKFLRALGNLNPSSKSDEEPDKSQAQVNENHANNNEPNENQANGNEANVII